MVDRQTFLRGAGGVGLAALGAGLPGAFAEKNFIAKKGTRSPNILVIVVDQMRYPQWFPDQGTLDQLLPSLARLRNGSVSFAHHYTAANACTPARSCLVTGLYTHQTGCLLTSLKPPQAPSSTPAMPMPQPSPTSTSAPAPPAPALDPGFPTWGTMLRWFGYQTYWYGKWHLSDACSLEPYGFSGGTCPSPNGGPGQGLHKDPAIVDQFIQWYQSYNSSAPWCTTVSLVNPHDIAWFWTLTRFVAGERNAPRVFTQLPPNFETGQQLYQNKPRLQISSQTGLDRSFGFLRYQGTGFEEGWLQLLDLYLLLQQYVDTQIGRVLDALASNPAVASNTIIIFTSDHGEYGGSHGMRNKAFAGYEEAINVPLYVKDPTGVYTRHPEITRTQLTSSVDIAALLVTLASGNNKWRHDSRFAQIAGRQDIATILRDPHAPGRSFILHTSDEDISEGATNALANNVASHVIAYRTTKGKFAAYSHWASNSTQILSSGQELECYDYSTHDGRLELTNTAGKSSQLKETLHQSLIEHAMPHELRAPLTKELQHVQKRALAAYYTANRAQQALFNGS